MPLERMVINMAETVCFHEIRPFIRYVQKFTVSENMSFHHTVAYDNRLFYILDGYGIIRVGDTVRHVKKGALMLWRAGIPYDLNSEKGQSCTMLGLNFDYTQKNSSKTAPIPPGREDQFNEADVLDGCRMDMEMFNGTVYLENMMNLEHLLNSMHEEYIGQRILSDGRLSAMLLTALTDITRECLLQGSNIGRSDSRVEDILKFIRGHYSEELSNHMLGQIFNYHPNYINRLMVAHTGLSLHKYILRYRINCAIDYLQTTDLPVSEIAKKVGFRDYNHFLKYFKKTTGYTTRGFRP